MQESSMVIKKIYSQEVLVYHCGFFLYFHVCVCVCVDRGRCSCGQRKKNRKARLPPLPFKKAKKFVKYWLTLTVNTLISLQQLENKLTSEMLIQLIQ